MENKQSVAELHEFAEFYVRNVINESSREVGVLIESKIQILIELIKLEIKTESICSIAQLKGYLESTFLDEMKIALDS